MINVIRPRIPSLTILLAAASMSLIGAPSFSAQADTAAKPPASPSTEASPDLPKYDVATIKPTTASDGRRMFMFTPDGVSLAGVPVQMMLKEAFGLEDDHIIGAPGWTRTNRYDLQAKVAPEDAPKLTALKFEQRRAMFLPLLVERFNLKYHHETRELSGYSLVVAKGGPKMKPSEVPPPTPDAKPPEPGASPKPGDPGAARPQQRRMLRLMGRGHLESEGTNAETLARVLSDQLGRTVVDKTGLTGNYDFTLQWTPDDAPPPTPGGADGGAPHNDNATDAVGPSLFTAVQEQLGLKLESSKGTADVIVIDHIDLPTEN
jgi:uncharacterized protein (TIGR03435 family)